MRGLNFVLGLAAGVLVGAAVSMLLTPASGQETRQNIRKATGHAKEMAQELRQKGRHYIETERVRIQEAIEAGRQAAKTKRAQLEKEMAQV